jgi:hypothetical protein
MNELGTWFIPGLAFVALILIFWVIRKLEKNDSAHEGSR